MTYFYDHLFAVEPEIRAMFPPAMAAQRRGFFEALGRIATWTEADNPRLSDDLRLSGYPRLSGYLRLSGYPRALGRSHRKFGVHKEHFDAMKAALDPAFRRYPPDSGGWRADKWDEAFGHAAGVMMGAAEHEAASRRRAASPHHAAACSNA